MTILRQFIIAPSLARLIQKERGGERVLEGYFPDQPQRRTYVQVEQSRSSLILEAIEGAALDEQVDLPLAHAQALLAVSHGQVEYVRTTLSIGPHEIQALHFVRPVALDLVAIAGAPEDGQNLPPLPWFGREVSIEPAYQRRRLALDGAPDAPEMDVANAALNCLLDLLEDRFTTWPVQGQAEEPGAPAADVSPALDAPVPAPETGTDEAIDDLGIEDEVIRELARSLQPRRG
jgi:CYTH domain-containing protein